MPASPSIALSAVELVKTYPAGRNKPRVRALDGLSIDVPAGSVFALLGPNGAGKSTTVKILTTLTRADSGTATVLGTDVARDPDAVRHSIGLVSQKPASDPMSTGRENLILAAQLHGVPTRHARARAEELLERFDLKAAAHRLTRTYSGGMSRKLDVAIGLMHRPRVLFLDEPTTGLDPEARAEMWTEIRQLSSDEATTVLLTTHYLDEADKLADRLAIVDRGKVVVHGTPDELKTGLRGDSVSLELDAAADAAMAASLLARLAGLDDIRAEGAAVHARAARGAEMVPAIITALEAAGLTAGSITTARPSLDDVYLRYAGRSYAIGDATGVAA